MADLRDIDIRFAREFNSAKALHDNELLDDCVESARELLEDPVVPRFHRMKTLLLLGSALEDLNEACDCLEEADKLWKLIRSYHLEGQDVDVDKTMAEVRASLDQLAKALKNEEAEEYDLEDYVEIIANTDECQVADIQEMICGMEMEDDLDIDMDSNVEDVAAGRASQVQVEPVKEPLPSTDKVESLDTAQHM
ncbi:hypothetical protein COCMIDRAFT_100857 [Bipolaris oryzae ATCC 44560]|uniref:Uncharacterized protein n=1 Tax=Bipolaris oryzae ATCC 44560 TaxID=930090 RepID=W6Z794_COCMI|nr:uncharacterized protein COCMIDRAFT_100857 [Bipolaris oryzae ATCC 44560]EUC43439.1 hypothetical protein COCMIDRAFT_100857 [Bipolaris oryzae ATCC 44560]